MKEIIGIIDLAMAFACQQIVDELEKRENKILCTQSIYGSTKYDVINAYTCDYENHIAEELEVKGVKANNGNLYVCCDLQKISYDEEDLKDTWENDVEQWHLVYDGKKIVSYDYLLVIPTLYNLIESIEQHY